MKGNIQYVPTHCYAVCVERNNVFPANIFGMFSGGSALWIQFVG